MFSRFLSLAIGTDGGKLVVPVPLPAAVPAMTVVIVAAAAAADARQSRGELSPHWERTVIVAANVAYYSLYQVY